MRCDVCGVTARHRRERMGARVPEIYRLCDQHVAQWDQALEDGSLEREAERRAKGLTAAEREQILREDEERLPPNPVLEDAPAKRRELWREHEIDRWVEFNGVDVPLFLKAKPSLRPHCVCTVPGCDYGELSRKVCRLHRDWLREQGLLDQVAPKRTTRLDVRVIGHAELQGVLVPLFSRAPQGRKPGPNARNCGVPGCEHKAKNSRFCRKHKAWFKDRGLYARFRKAPPRAESSDSARSPRPDADPSQGSPAPRAPARGEGTTSSGGSQ